MSSVSFASSGDVELFDLLMSKSTKVQTVDIKSGLDEGMVEVQIQARKVMCNYVHETREASCQFKQGARLVNLDGRSAKKLFSILGNKLGAIYEEGYEFVQADLVYCAQKQSLKKKSSVKEKSLRTYCVIRD